MCGQGHWHPREAGDWGIASVAVGGTCRGGVGGERGGGVE